MINRELIKTFIITGHTRCKIGWLFVGFGWGERVDRWGCGVFFLKKVAKSQWKSLCDREYERQPKLSITFISVLIRNCLHIDILRMSQLYKQLMHFEGVCFCSSGALKVLSKELKSFPVEMIWWYWKPATYLTTSTNIKHRFWSGNCWIKVTCRG